MSAKFAIIITCFLAGILAVLKFTLGVASGSVSTLASAVDSLLDLLISLFNFVMLKKSAKSPNLNFNYGFVKLQAVACLFEGSIIALSGLYLFYEIYNSYGTPITNIKITLILMGVATLVSLFISRFLLAMYKKTGVLVLKADSLHYETDVKANLSVFVSLILVYFTGINLIDLIVGAGISIWIIYSAIKLIKEGIEILMDKAVDFEILEGIKEILEKSRINNYHALRSRLALDTAYLEIHLVFDTNISLFEAHAISDEIEETIKKTYTQYKWEITTHLDPLDDSQSLKPSSLRSMRFQNAQESSDKDKKLVPLAGESVFLEIYQTQEEAVESLKELIIEDLNQDESYHDLESILRQLSIDLNELEYKDGVIITQAIEELIEERKIECDIKKNMLIDKTTFAKNTNPTTLGEKYNLNDLINLISTLRHYYKKQNDRFKDPYTKLLKATNSAILEGLNKAKNSNENDSSIVPLIEIIKSSKLNDIESIIFILLLHAEFTRSDNANDMYGIIKMLETLDYDLLEIRTAFSMQSKLRDLELMTFEEPLDSDSSIAKIVSLKESALEPILLRSEDKTQRLKILLRSKGFLEILESKQKLSRDLKSQIVLEKSQFEALEAFETSCNEQISAVLEKYNLKYNGAKAIFYGPSGVGKTMAALALGNALDKVVLSLDCSKILSMWMGESEKNIRKIFTHYEEIREKLGGQKPILLLDEADQFLQTRSNSPISGEHTYNKMQNIFLEQIERFDGILIATTNMIDNLDNAFARRFSHKVEFTLPNRENREKIWEMYLPKELLEDGKSFAPTLSIYELSPAQINLIVARAITNMSIKNQKYLNLDDLINFTKDEIKNTFNKDIFTGFIR